MAYVELIKRGRKEYFYLTKNVRSGPSSWKKIREYLGDKKPSGEEIASTLK